MLVRRRWLAVLVPFSIVVLVELLSDSILDAQLPFPRDSLLVSAVLLVAGLGLARFAFARIDRLTGELEARNADLERRDATVRALHRLSLAIAATSDLEAVLRLVADQAVELLPADAALLEIDHGHAARGRFVTGPADRLLAATAPAGARLESPLRSGVATIGRLVALSGAERSYGSEELETLAALANQASIAIEQDRLHGRLLDLAVVQERERIAREMHDGLAQVLGYVNTKSQAVEHLLDTGRVADARSQLDELASAARSIYVDIREAILGLRSSIEPGEGLVAGLRAYADRFAEASKLVVAIEVIEPSSGPDLDLLLRDGLSDVAAEETLRIVQEALTNIRKHARARRATIRIVAAEDRVIVEIEDDGRGMRGLGDGSGDWPRYGLAAMRERAARIGAGIDWSDGPDGGTIVRIALPLAALVA